VKKRKKRYFRTMKKRNILLAVLAVLVVIQFFQIDKTPLESDPSHDFIAMENPPAHIGQMIKGACYDCHSNHTKHPWYTSIQPVGWWIRGHYRGARMNLNFSEWKDYNDEDKPLGMKECAEVVEQRRMPPKSYRWMHPEAQLTDEQLGQLAAYFQEKSRG
jgi:hypothetical protein